MLMRTVSGAARSVLGAALVAGVLPLVSIASTIPAEHAAAAAPPAPPVRFHAQSAFHAQDAGIGATVTVPPISIKAVTWISTPPVGGLGDLTQTLNSSANTLFGFLTNVLCTVGALVPSPIGGLVCDLGILQFTIHTVYKKPGGGEVVRDTFALAAVPTLVDITGDGIPDALATVGLTSLNQLTLTITKLPFAAAILPAEVELVVRDPSNVNSPSRIALGYDQRATTIPSTFKASASLLGLNPLHLGVTVSQTGADAQMTLVGAMFQLQQNGTWNIGAQATLHFVPAPPTMSYDVLLDSTHKHVTATSSQLSTVTADVSLINGPEVQAIHAVINQLPQQVDVDYLSADSTHRTITYSALTPIANLGFLYQDVTYVAGGTVLNTEATGTIQNLPTGLTVTQTGPKTVTASTHSGPIGSVEGGFAIAEHVVPVSGTGSGARLETTNGSLTTAAVRIAGLTAVSVDATGPYAVDIQSMTQPVHVVDIDNDKARTIDASVENLPAHITLGIDPDNGKVSEDGHGQGIDLISADVTSATPFFSRATHIHADLHTIPANFNLAYTTAPGSFSANIDNPLGIGEVDFFADDGAHSTAVPWTFSGFAYVDVPSEYAMAARVQGLRGLSLMTNQGAPPQTTPLSLSAQTTHPQMFKATAQVFIPAAASSPAQTITANATVDLLPATFSISLMQGLFTTLSYGGQAIKELQVDLSSDVPFYTDSNTNNVLSHIAADITGIPASFNLDLGTFNGATQFKMTPPATSIALRADDGVHVTQVPSTIAGPLASGISYNNVTGGHMAVAALVYGLRNIQFQAQPKLVVDVQTTGGYVFDIAALMDQTIDKSGVPLEVHAEIDTLPSDVTVTVDSSVGATIDYDGHGQVIDRIEGTASGPLFFGRAHYIYGKVLGLPAQVHMVAGVPTGQPPVTTLVAVSTPVGSDAIKDVEFQALDDPSRPLVSFPVPHTNQTSPDSDGLVFHDLRKADGSDGEFTIAAQVHGMRSVNLIGPTPLDFSLDLDGTQSKAFGIDMQTQLRTFNPSVSDGLPTPFTSTPVDAFSGFIDKPQPQTKLTIQPASDVSPLRMEYHAANAISEIKFDHNANTGSGFPGIHGSLMNADITNVPTQFSFCQDGTVTDGNGSPCVRTNGFRPAANGPYPAYPADFDNTAGSSKVNANHSFTIDFDDHGSTPKDTPMFIRQLYLCLQDNHGNCVPDEGNGGALEYLDVSNLNVHNVMADVLVNACSGALVCGHVGLDTRNTSLDGSIFFFDQNFPFGHDFWADLELPEGFAADYRYTNFTNQDALSGGSYDHEYGTINCPAATQLNAQIDLAGGGTLSNANVAQEFLCHINGRHSAWYPNG